MDETEKVCIERFEAFGCGGRASDICAINLDVMAERYKSGALRQVVH
jgi:fructose-bisphosphate aldolase, class II